MNDEEIAAMFTPSPPCAQLLGWRLLDHDEARGWIKVGFVGTDAPDVQPPPRSGGNFSAATAGLYGGTLNKTSCDAQKLVTFLQGVPDKAKAWADASYRGRLFEDATAAIAEFGFKGRQGEHMVAVENTNHVHNLVVCTLCSCYPWTVLGLPPVWYKSPPYRSRAVIDPRGVLKEFGVTLPDTTKVRVWDSTAEVRYLVVPIRPAGTDGWSEEKLADLVTRDSMIGTGLPKAAA